MLRAAYLHSPTRSGLIAAILAFAFYAIIINFGAQIDGHSIGWAYWYRLSTHGKKAQAVVGRDSGELGCYFLYRDGTRTVRGPYDLKCRLATGTNEDITYLPGQPNSETSGSPGEMLEFLTIVPAGMSILFGLMHALRVCYLKKKETP